MKVLQLCIKPPYPPVDGGTLAMDSVTQGLLAEGHTVKVLSVCSKKHPVRHEALPDNYLRQTDFESVFIDLGIHPLDAAFALLCGESYHVKRYISKAFEEKLSEVLQQDTFDIVHMESIFLTPYLPTIRKFSDASVVLRAHNVEHRIWQQIAQGTRNPFKRWYLKKLALALRLYEVEHLNAFDGIACITGNDADTFRQLGCRKPIADIPFGILPEMIENVDEEPDTLFHIGSMDWRPNEEGIRWFLKEVWPAVHREIPGVKLYLAGRKMPDDLMQLQMDNVIVVGEVPDSAYFMASKQLNIVPLLAGSGIRVKIIEAMAMRKVVITTRTGAEGIQYTDGENILIADTPEQFVAHIKNCLDHPDQRNLIAENAYRLISENYSTPALTQRLVDFYNKILRPSLSQENIQNQE